MIKTLPSLHAHVHTSTIYTLIMYNNTCTHVHMTKCLERDTFAQNNSIKHLFSMAG